MASQMSLVFMRKRVVAEYVLVIGELIINRQTQVVERWQSVTPLSKLHYLILQAIAESHSKPLSRSDLITNVLCAEPQESGALGLHI